jgi:ABC-type transport system involved in multi-copper enzyme maturation permease subunit
VKVRTIALNTIGTFLHNKVILVVSLLFVCDLLMGIYSVLLFRSDARQIDSLLHDIGATLDIMGGLGTLLAVWAAADSVASEMKSGTILAVLARPLHRWQFLAGKYLGVLMLMLIYVFGAFGVAFLLSRLGGQPFQYSAWPLLVYPLVHYAVWAAISMFLVTFLLNPVVVMGIVAVMASLIRLLVSPAASNIPDWIRLPLHLILPLTTSVLSEDRFLRMTHESLKRYPWTYHATALVYGLDYALVCFLLAAFVFQHRSLSSH